MKSGNLNFLEPSGPLQACNGTALPLRLFVFFQELTFLDNVKCHSSIRRNGLLLDPAYLALPGKMGNYVGYSVQGGGKNC